MHRLKPVILCILDGWGHRDNNNDNAISSAHTPHWDHLLATCPHTLLEASECNVGLPEGQMGNSEVGHMTLGSGRVILQGLPRIDQSIATNTLKDNKHLQEFIHKLKITKGTCHLLGLLSPGGVHSHENHIFELARILSLAHIPVAIHAVLDGRDTPPQSAGNSLKKLEIFCQNHPFVFIASLSGRYYAMDRDKRWDRTYKAYNAIVCPEFETPYAVSAEEALSFAYQQGITDEFIFPTALHSYKGLQPNDGVLMANFRADRARQILQALVDPQFNEFERKTFFLPVAALGMASYSEFLDSFMNCLFPTFNPTAVLGEIFAKEKLKQLRIAETEKYAHVTFFFNGGQEDPFPGEDRILIPSSSVATYDLKPEMSALEITDVLTDAIAENIYDFIVVNYANTDMVGHTGNLEATRKAVETVDDCLGRLIKATKKVHGCLVITADHGNAEVMEDKILKCPHTAHTLNPVPFVIFNEPARGNHLNSGTLADVAPTILDLMQIQQPLEMTGRTLLT